MNWYKNDYFARQKTMLFNANDQVLLGRGRTPKETSNW